MWVPVLLFRQVLQPVGSSLYLSGKWGQMTVLTGLLGGGVNRDNGYKNFSPVWHLVTFRELAERRAFPEIPHDLNQDVYFALPRSVPFS